MEPAGPGASGLAGAPQPRPTHCRAKRVGAGRSAAEHGDEELVDEVDIDFHAVVRGVPRLVGTAVAASDIRAGAALVVAALAAEGETSIDGVHHVDRGYEDLVGKLRTLGADIVRLD